jgi:hypothetical protein
MLQLFICLILLLTSCNNSPQNATAFTTTHHISGRDEGTIPYNRTPIYRAKIPNAWLRKDPSAHESIQDSKKALCEYIIQDPEGQIRITIHNFPADNAESRIPPNAQVARWKRQFTQLDIANTHIDQKSWGGFAGLYFEGNGILEGKTTLVMGWAMQLAPEHYSTLDSAIEDKSISKQMRAEYTIKAVGSPQSMENHRQQIHDFARSFELIQDIPAPS